MTPPAPAGAALLKRRRGQALVETAIIMPTMVFLILGIVQLSMIQQARLMLEYAAFTAARTGIVWNANQKLMEDAALMVLTPTFGVSASEGLGFSVNGAHDLGSFAKTYLIFQGLNDAAGLTGGLLPKLVKVEILNPVQETLDNLNGGSTEVDFDEPATRQQSQLTIRVRYYYNMRIPYANWIIWQSFMAANAGVNLVRKVDGWYLNFTDDVMGPGVSMESKAARLAIAGATAKVPGQCYNNIPSDDFLVLTGLAEANTFLIPIVTSYTMRMQSNAIKQNLPKISDVLANCN